MEQTFLQQRIEEQAKDRLLKDLVTASNREQDNKQMFYEHYEPQIHAEWYYHTYNNGKEVRLRNDYTKQLFDKMLPAYVRMITDEILRKINEIDYLLESKQEEENF